MILHVLNTLKLDIVYSIIPQINYTLHYIKYNLTLYYFYILSNLLNNSRIFEFHHLHSNHSHMLYYIHLLMSNNILDSTLYNYLVILHHILNNLQNILNNKFFLKYSHRKTHFIFLKYNLMSIHHHSLNFNRHILHQDFHLLLHLHNMVIIIIIHYTLHSLKLLKVDQHIIYNHI